MAVVFSILLKAYPKIILVERWKCFIELSFGFMQFQRKVRFRDSNRERDVPKLTQRVKTFYVESWPEVDGKLVGKCQLPPYII